jgi:hypothetical protein
VGGLRPLGGCLPGDNVNPALSLSLLPGCYVVSNLHYNKLPTIVCCLTTDSKIRMSISHKLEPPLLRLIMSSMSSSSKDDTLSQNQGVTSAVLLPWENPFRVSSSFW